MKGRRMRETEDDKMAMARCVALGLHPKPHPMGDDHHTDVSFSPDDEKIGFVFTVCVSLT